MTGAVCSLTARSFSGRMPGQLGQLPLSREGKISLRERDRHLSADRKVSPLINLSITLY